MRTGALYIFGIFTCLLVKQSIGSISGFYVDNGKHQTVLHNALSGDDQVEIEHELLDLLGLPNRPRRKHSHPSMRKSAPQFLLDVYQRLINENNEGGNRVTRSIDDYEDNLITSVDEEAIDQSNMIMTFLNKHHHVPDVRHEHGRRLLFDVSEVSPDIELMVAELRLYQNPLSSKWYGTGNEFIITVYIITHHEGHKELEVLTSKNTTSDHHGWLEMNITMALERWITNNKCNKGLYIGVHSKEHPEHEVRLEDIGLINSRGDDEYQPFMVAYFKGEELIRPSYTPTRRAKRSTKPRHRKQSTPKNPLLDKPHEYKNCQIQMLYVNFKDLNWQDWIIAPPGYPAYYCSGECNFPLNAHMNATNHAIVQTLVHLLSPSKVPKPCCAPTKLNSISVLYYIDESNVNLKKFKNMVVKSCGCQ